MIAPANPLRGVKPDSEYLKSVLATVSGPIVLVGHSYGGFVATDAATGNSNVKALVYIAAFAPELGESAGEVEARNPGSEAAGENLETRPYPGGVDIYIKPSDFHRVFCAGVHVGSRSGSTATPTISLPSGSCDWISPGWSSM